MEPSSTLDRTHKGNGNILCCLTEEVYRVLGFYPPPPHRPIPCRCFAYALKRQAVWYRRQINGGLLLSVLPLTFIGVLLSLNVFSSSVLAAFVPAVGACLLGLSLTKLWMNLAVRRKKDSCFFFISFSQFLNREIAVCWCSVAPARGQGRSAGVIC